ncbi:MAG: F0F1 ATP synthase subunit B [Bacteroidia bacterium]
MELVLPKLGLVFWTALLFLVFAWILAKFAWKPILAALKAREEGIENSLLEAERARDEMANLKSQNEDLLKEARRERDLMIQEANRMRDQIVTEAKTKAAAEAGKELDKAKQQIAAEKKAALAEIKNTAGSLAVDIAEKLLRKQLDDRDAQKTLAETLIGEMNQN